MTSARSAILGRIRRSLGVSAEDGARIDKARQHIARHDRQLVPERANQAAGELYAQFCAFLEGQQAKILETATLADVPAVLARYLSRGELHTTIRFGGDARLAAMAWDGAGLTVRHGAADPADQIGVSFALAGIAETGTLVIAAGADNPVTLAFLPATHIIVVERAAIVGSYEDALEIVRAAFGATAMPRTLNYISGPSRTADIGGKIVIGAHGPRNLVVIVVGERDE